MFDKMVDMKKTPMELEQNVASVPQESVYPYGLSITLGDEEIEKLGIDCDDDECQVGNYVHGHFLAEITGYHKSDTSNGTKRTLNIQMTHLELEDEQSENDDSDNEIGEGKILRAAGPY